jgi:hypothetical protein
VQRMRKMAQDPVMRAAKLPAGSTGKETSRGMHVSLTLAVTVR